MEERQTAVRTVIRLYEEYVDAISVVDELERSGFSRDDVSIIVLDQDNPHASVLNKCDNEGSDAELGAASAGGVAGSSAGIAAVPVPGLGPVAAADWLAAGLRRGGAVITIRAASEEMARRGEQVMDGQRAADLAARRRSHFDDTAASYADLDEQGTPSELSR